MCQVDGKIAIVTGGASGIGAACATTLAREGAKVVVTDVDDVGGQAVVDKIWERRRRGDLLASGRQPRGELAGCDRSHRTAFRALERCDAPCRWRLHHHYVFGCRSSRVGRVGRLLRDEA
jgi:NAD(P)-dependent dehydrogenase (short-subunit alcohol dehydrogenase family)